MSSIFPKDVVDRLQEKEGWQIAIKKRNGQETIRIRKEGLGGFDLVPAPLGHYIISEYYLWEEKRKKFSSFNGSPSFTPILDEFQKTYPELDDLDQD